MGNDKLGANKRLNNSEKYNRIHYYEGLSCLEFIYKLKEKLSFANKTVKIASVSNSRS